MITITLRAARINSGFKLKEVAVETGNCPETISKYENDSTRIPRDMLEKLVALYGVPEEYIFFGRESVFTERIRRNSLKQRSAAGA